jgi:tRNA (mo5U34)-methyltransferase
VISSSAELTARSEGALDSLRRQVAGLPWFHQIDLGNGIVTPGPDRTAAKLQTLDLPADLSGKTVLDIGAWDGFFSFEAERRGAARVLATDSFCWGGEGWGSKASFELARRALNSRVEDRTIDVHDLTPSAVGRFDVVLMLGVLYHLRNPMLALERVASVTSGLLILESHVDLLSTHRPALAFYGGSETNGDPTNWNGPNLAALAAMLEAVGFSRVEVVSCTDFRQRLRRAARTALSQPHRFFELLQQGRAVVHAWK